MMGAKEIGREWWTQGDGVREGDSDGRNDEGDSEGMKDGGRRREGKRGSKRDEERGKLIIQHIMRILNTKCCSLLDVVSIII